MGMDDAEMLAKEGGFDFMTIDGFDEAFLGLVERCGQPVLACYSRERITEILMERDGMTNDEANEYIDFNILGAWVGEMTPVLLS